MIFSKVFGIKKMNRRAAEAFWKYFEQEQDRFIEVLKGNDRLARRAIIDEVDRMLCPVFPYVKAECIGFQMGSHNGVHEFVLFHGGLMQLAKDMYTLCEMMPEHVYDVWTVSLIE